MSRSRTRFAILGILAAGPGSGYDLKKTVERLTSHFWSESYGQIYPILKEMAKERLVRSRVVRQKSRPDRTVYAITAKGKKVLRQWLEEPAQLDGVRNETLLKLFFGAESSLPGLREKIEEYRTRHLQLLEDYADLERTLRDESDDGEVLAYWLMTISHARHQARAVVRWSDETLRELARLEKRSQ